MKLGNLIKTLPAKSFPDWRGKYWLGHVRKTKFNRVHYEKYYRVDNYIMLPIFKDGKAVKIGVWRI